MVCLADARTFQRMRVLRSLPLALLAGAQFIASGAGAQMLPPIVPIPEGVQTFEIGTQLTDKGVPMHIRGFISSKRPHEVVKMFRHGLGNPLVEDTVSGKLVLGRAHGDYYLTIQMSAAGEGTRGIIAIANLGAAIHNRETTRSEDAKLLSRLPPGSKVISRTGSIDRNANAEYVVLSNGHSPSLNARYVKSLLGEDGFAFERESVRASKSHGRSSGSSNGKTLYFRGAGGEAMAVIFQGDDASTTVVLNIIRNPGSEK